MNICFLILLIILFILSPCLNAQSHPPGYPNRVADFDVKPGFKNPPAGYGEVPFYWWLGDTLTRERLLWQLDKLSGKSISSLQINYAHDDKGGLKWGLSLPSKPALFSDEWWDLVNWFMQEAKKRGMAVSLSDYTLGVGQNSYVDEAIRDYPELNGYELYHETKPVPQDSLLYWELPANSLSVIAYRLEDQKLIFTSALNLKDNINQNMLNWVASDGEWLVVCVFAKKKIPSLDPMNPKSGKAYVEKFFQRFEERFPGEAGKGFNFFFSDELDFQLSGYLWNDIFEKEFFQRNGYSILPELPALFMDIGQRTAKIRLDYNEVMVSLSEEGFFRPIYQWQQERGMIYGCDHGGRGKDVTEFGDYFRTQKYNQGPGCDQPFLRQDIIKNKIASSIAHLYERPRTWLEGFHSSGWSTNSAALSDAIFGNYVMGQNLLSLHGLYYSTHGGWWEWAPPDNHFRMPYYEHMEPLMKCVERLSYLLSQGYHRCDVAILYPVEPMIAKMGGEKSVKAAFRIGEYLYNKGIDFDFIDYESVQRAEVVENELHVSGEKYKVLIIPSMEAIRFSTVKKALAFFREGGVVINFGALPQASERIGSDDVILNTMLDELFGRRAVDTSSYGKSTLSRTNGKAISLMNFEEIKKLITNSFPRDFKVVSSPSQETLPRVMHRKIGKRDIYAIYNLDKGSECFFRAKGSVELWDPFSGEIRPLYHAKQVNEGMIVTLPLEKSEVQLIVFNPEENFSGIDSTNLEEILSIHMNKNAICLTGITSSGRGKWAKVKTATNSYFLNGKATAPLPAVKFDEEWEFEIKPVLDNRWGDYHWPPTNELIGPEIRRTRYADENAWTRDCEKPDFDDSRWPVVSNGFGPVFLKLGPLSDDVNISELSHRILSSGSITASDGMYVKKQYYRWQPYYLSWRYGVENDPGHQGYHGLKEEMYDEFIRLGKKGESWTSTFYEKEDEGNNYFLFTNVFAPHSGKYQILTSDIKPSTLWINNTSSNIGNVYVELKKGNNPVLLLYNQPGTTYFIIKEEGIYQNTAVTGDGSLSMKWYGDKSILAFNTRPSENTPAGWYRFQSAPGLKQLNFAAYGKVRVWINGIEYKAAHDSIRDDYSIQYSVKLENAIQKPVSVALRIEQEIGFYEGAALPTPIKMKCEKGIYYSGDWSQSDGLFSYSGGACYSKNISLTKEQVNAGMILDLGKVISSAEVVINNKNAGIRLNPPFHFDISGLVQAGENNIKILVYNTAANHYTSIPTRYRGVLDSGLFGPVVLEFKNIVQLKN